MTEILERDLTTQEQIDNAHDAKFKETLERLGKIPDPIVLEFKDGKGWYTVIREQIIYPYYKQFGLDDNAKTDNSLVNKIIAKLIKYDIMKSTNDTVRDGETKKVKRKIIIEAVQEYLQEKNGQSNNGRETAQEKRELPPVVTLEFDESGLGLFQVIREQIINKYYPDLSGNESLVTELGVKIKDYGTIIMGGKHKKIENINNIPKNCTIEIDGKKIQEAINPYLNKNGGNNGHETAPQQQVQPQTQPQQQPQTPEQGQSVEEMTDEKIYVVKKGDNIDNIIQNEIYGYFPDVDYEYKFDDNNLLIALRQYLKNKNNLKVVKNNIIINEGQKLKFKLSEIRNIINNRIEEEKKLIEIIDGKEYIKLTNLKDFREGTKLINRVYSSDAGFRSRVESAISGGEAVLIPAYTEKKDSKTLELNDIIKPDKEIDKKLDGKTFVLDPGHGFNDSGALGLVGFGDKPKTKVVLFESAIAMDITYRTAKLLRAHGAKVEFTHYMTSRGISNDKDLAPCLQYGGNGGTHQDKWTDKKGYTTGKVEKKSSKDKNGNSKRDGSIDRRVDITNGLKTSPNMFISIHMNSGMGKEVEYENRDPEKEKSLAFAEHLQECGFGKTSKRGAHVNPKTGKIDDGLGVLNGSKCPSVLVEMGDLQNQDDANIFRDPQQRQKKAEDLVKAMVGYSR